MSFPERIQDEPPTPGSPDQSLTTPSFTHQTPAIPTSPQYAQASTNTVTPHQTATIPHPTHQRPDTTLLIPESTATVLTHQIPDTPLSIPSIPESTVPNRSNQSDESLRQCWICFATEEDDDTLAFIQPCNCRGSTKWVHHKCLLQWVDEKQDGNVRKIIYCPQCKAEYLLFFPQSHALGQMVENVDKMIYRVCPYITGCIVAGSFYWMAVSYGAITVATVIGEEEAVEILNTYEPSVILTALPAIPSGLLIMYTIRWEDACLKFLRNISPHLPILKYFLPGPLTNHTGAPQEIEVNERMTCTRIFTGAFLLPVIAKICGETFFPGLESPLYRTLAGGTVFIMAKGCFTMFHKQQVYKKLSRRRILDYTEDNLREMRRNRTVYVQTLNNEPTVL